MTMDMFNESLSSILRAYGVQTDFINFAGERQAIPEQDQWAVLSALNVDIFKDNTPAQPCADKMAMLLQRDHKQQHSRMLPPVAVFTCQKSTSNASVTLQLPEYALHETLVCRIVTEQGEHFENASGLLNPAALDLHEIDRIQLDTTWHIKLNLQLSISQLPPGYHSLFVQAGKLSATMSLIVAPERCFQPPALAQQKKLWGLSVQLYSLCSARSLGMGDFADLRLLMQQVAKQGAGFIVLNPLHAGALHYPENCSPYSPIDRRRINPLYIDPLTEPDFLEGEAVHWLADSRQAAQLRVLIAQEGWIDYTQVTELKFRIFERMYERFLIIQQQGGSKRVELLNEFVQLQGDALRVYARWQAQHSVSAAGQFAQSEQFYCYLQWLAEMQLQSCQDEALALGMPIGLVRDLAVGSARDGTEVGEYPGLFCTKASIGAPPDPLAPQGQNWGLPPLSPRQLSEHAYQPFSKLLRSNMSHCGALRIDHVMALMRLWWCPYEDSGHGAYVTYPAADLFAILRLESHRQQCMVIGEDLGIVPEEVKRHLSESGIFSNVLFYFEKSSPCQFKQPQDYPERALAMLANHDVPTLAAWWCSGDLELRFALGLTTDPDVLKAQKQQRQQEKLHMLQLLEAQWLLPANRFSEDRVDRPVDHDLAAALMRCCSRTRSALVSVQLEDLALLQTPVNIPGTSNEYKNWRRKLPMDLIEQLGSEPISRLLESLRVERP
ncbi:MAG: 4-alpha-glucanotransferase [Pseudohongiella sp.]|nr:4-alpha-glucanotransferase [Pseudohongiella sp.]